MRIGVLALQGAFREHMLMLEALDVAVAAVRLPEQLAGCDGLIIPGGESTTISKLMERYGFAEPVMELHEDGMAVWGTCAGAILVAGEIIDAVPGQRSLALVDMSIRRNAYGRQVDSFEADLDFKHVSGGAFPGVFIRAPWIERASEVVEILATHEGHAVAARQGTVLATTFHPELTGDPRIHRYFVERVVQS